MTRSQSFWRLSILGAGLAIIALVAFNLIGSTIDAQGVLHEPFFLIPVFWVLTLISVGCAIVALIVRQRT